MSLPQVAARSIESAIPAQLQSAHLIGICGSGMFPLAQALAKAGVAVSGSDQGAEKADKLHKIGVRFHLGHEAANICSQQVVVVSTAISADNPEIVAARKQGIPIVHRSEMLGWFLARVEPILIAGTHGKTTTTTMVGLLLEALGVDPWCFVGGTVQQFGGNVRLGTSHHAVAEADESDGSFLNLPRTHVIATNIEAEHLNHWGNFENLLEGFAQLVEGMPAEGQLVLCLDDPGARQLIERISRPVVGYGLHTHDAEFQAVNVVLRGESSTFDLIRHGVRLCHVHLGVPGQHNVSNATAAYALLVSMGFDVHEIGDALADFHGVDRRFTKRVAKSGFMVIDDYAHHPTEIAVTIAAARRLAHERGGRLLGVFQPHRYTRIADLFNDFGQCFTGLDELLMMEIYTGGEAPIEGVTSELFHARVTSQYGFPVRLCRAFDVIEKIVSDTIKNDDTVLLLGAGSVTKLAPLLASR